MCSSSRIPISHLAQKIFFQKSVFLNNDMEINGDGRRKLVKEFISHVHDGSMCRYPVSFGKGEKELMLKN